MGFELEDRPGSVKVVTDLIQAHGGRIASILSGYGGAPESFLRVYIRAREVQDEEALRKDLEGKNRILYYIHEKLD